MKKSPLNMKKFLLLLSFVFATVSAVATQNSIPKNYYNSAAGLSGYSLKTALHNIIKDHKVRSYSQLWGDMQVTDNDGVYENDNTVLDIYSEDPYGPDPYNFAWKYDQCGSYRVEGNCYNREHSFPKSWFNSKMPMYTDLFHIYPTDGKVNGMRANWVYGEVDKPKWISENGSKLGSSAIAEYSGMVFEPIDAFKGDMARTYFYMATRYEDIIDGKSWSSDILDGSNDKVYVDWFLNMILNWHLNDPVSKKEINRNNAIYGIQNNRNPFIDHPEYVTAIWGNPK